MTVLNAPRARALVLAAAIAGGLGLGVGSAQAAGGCGPGFHPNPWGVCRPNWGPRPAWGRPVGYGDYGYARPRPFHRPHGGFGGYGGYGPRPSY